jgi:hypothetical protein
VLAFALVCTSYSASAQILYSTGFENPPFANGSQLVGQDGWVVGAPFLSPAAAVITNSTVQSGAQALQVRGVDMVNAPEVDPLAAVGSYRKPINFDATVALPIVRFQSNVRLDGPTLGSGDFFSANIAARSGDGGVGELSISSDGRVYGYAGAVGDPIIFNVPVSLNAWHTLGIAVNFTTNSYAFSVDGVSSTPFAFPAGFNSDTFLRASIVTYAKPDAGATVRSSYVARYDNLSVTAVPEPTTIGFALGVVSFIGAARRRRTGH